MAFMCCNIHYGYMVYLPYFREGDILENFDCEWIAELERQTKEDILYYPLEQKMAPLRHAYQKLRQELLPEQREILDSYFYLSKQMKISTTRIAYTIGMKHGQNRAKRGPTAKDPQP